MAFYGLLLTNNYKTIIIMNSLYNIYHHTLSYKSFLLLYIFKYTILFSLRYNFFPHATCPNFICPLTYKPHKLFWVPQIFPILSPNKFFVLLPKLGPHKYFSYHYQNWAIKLYYLYKKLKLIYQYDNLYKVRCHMTSITKPIATRYPL